MSDPIKQGELYKLLWPAYESETYNDETRKRASDELNKVLDAARADFEELLNVRTFHLKYGPANLAEWDKNTLRELDALYQVKTIEKIKKWFGEGAP